MKVSEAIEINERGELPDTRVKIFLQRLNNAEAVLRRINTLSNPLNATPGAVKSIYDRSSHYLQEQDDA